MKVDESIRTTVTNLLLENQQLTGAQLQEQAEKNSKFHYTVRTYQNLKNELEILNSSLEQKWSLGSAIGTGSNIEKLQTCREIPAQSLPRVISIQKMLYQHNEMYLTIRRARWVARLEPILASLDDVTFHIIANLYTRAEQAAEINKQNFVDTSSLDELFILKQDYTFECLYGQWIDFYRPYLLSDGLGWSDQSIEKNVRQSCEGINNNELKIVIRVIDLMLHEETEKSITLAKQHPEIHSYLKQWIVFNTRQTMLEMFY